MELLYKYRRHKNNLVAYCGKENKPCVKWVEKYLKDCLCNTRDELSFAFGIMSMISWGFAEIPQIFTNFRTKSSHGVSLLFLFGWALGDTLNLVGCLLEPATLPTQFYTAFLYTMSTIILVIQSLYYNYIYPWLKHHHKNVQVEVEEEQKSLNPELTNQAHVGIPSSTAARGAMVATTLSLPVGGNALSEGYRAFSGRKMLLRVQEHSREHNTTGQLMGWMMAAIYMSGLIPQIVLNINRGSVQGLNPLMFIFAIIANVTYVLSILVRSTELEGIKANLPWLLDAVVCVVLHLFIIMQYVYYKHIQKRNSREEDQGFYYEETHKSDVS